MLITFKALTAKVTQTVKQSLIMLIQLELQRLIQNFLQLLPVQLCPLGLLCENIVVFITQAWTALLREQSFRSSTPGSAPLTRNEFYNSLSMLDGHSQVIISIIIFQVTNCNVFLHIFLRLLLKASLKKIVEDWQQSEQIK